MIKFEHDLIEITLIDFEVFLDLIDLTTLSQGFKKLICRACFLRFEKTKPEYCRIHAVS
jgi:hypothetical protein